MRNCKFELPQHKRTGILRTVSQLHTAAASSKYRSTGDLAIVNRRQLHSVTVNSKYRRNGNRELSGNFAVRLSIRQSPPLKFDNRELSSNSQSSQFELFEVSSYWRIGTRTCKPTSQRCCQFDNMLY